MIDDLIGMQPVIPPAPIEDLANLDGAESRVCIKGTTRNLRRLAELTSLEVLWAGDVNEAQFAGIVESIDPLYLSFDGLRAAELSPLGRLSRLQALEVRWNTKVSDISFLERLTGLRLLALSHCPKVHDLGPIAALRNLEVLDLSGGMWSTFKPDTLKPLAGLDKLRGLSLKAIRVADRSLEPVAQLKGLRKLELSNQFPTEEYARLSVALPQVECTHFVPYFEVNFGRGRQVMVTGSGKPVLTLPRDQARLDGYVERFRAAQTRFRETY
jgi:hypothetical protein